MSALARAILGEWRRTRHAGAAVNGVTRPGGRHAIGQPMAWAAVAGFLATDILWCARIGMSVDGWWTAVGAICITLVLAIGYRRRSPAIADTAEGASLWIAFTATGCVLTYLFATWALPLQDAALAEADRAIGFDWLAWRSFVLARPPLYWVLVVAYASLLPQIVLACLYFPARGLSERGSELLLGAMVTLPPTTIISALWPVLGPFATFDRNAGTYLPHLLTLRADGPWHFNLLTLEGIIQMPSYHMVLAMLFVYAFRGTGWWGWGIAGLNGLMLLSIPPIGGHYLVDMFAGSAIALICILGARGLAYSRRRKGAGRLGRGY
jgi:hypothetical protein